MTRHRSLLVMSVICTAACASNGALIKATANYATLSGSTLGEVGNAPTIVRDLCQQRIEMEYVLRRQLPNAVLDFDEFIAKPFATNEPYRPTTTWKQLCDGYAPVDDAFAKAIASLGAYGASLGEIAGNGYAPSVNIATLAGDAGTDATKLGPDAARYKDAVTGLGRPLGALANAITTRWVAGNLVVIVDRADPPVQALVKQLVAFVTIVRTEHLAETRAVYKDLREELDLMREQKPDLVSGVMIAALDVEMARRFAQTDAKLKSLTDLLVQLGNAHAALKKGWAKGDHTARATLKELSGIAKAAYADVKLFQNPPVTP